MSAEPADPRTRLAVELEPFFATRSGWYAHELSRAVADFLAEKVVYRDALAAADAVIPPRINFELSVQQPPVTPDTVAFRLLLPPLADDPPKRVFTLFADGRVELDEGSSATESGREFWDAVKLNNPYARAAVVSPPPSADDGLVVLDTYEEVEAAPYEGEIDVLSPPDTPTERVGWLHEEDGRTMFVSDAAVFVGDAKAFGWEPVYRRVSEKTK